MAPVGCAWLISLICYDQTHLRYGDQWNSFRGDTALVLYGSGGSTHNHGRTLHGEWNSSARQSCTCHHRCHIPRCMWFQYECVLIRESVIGFPLLSMCSRVMWRVEFFRAATQSCRLQRVEFFRALASVLQVLDCESRACTMQAVTGHA